MKYFFIALVFSVLLAGQKTNSVNQFRWLEGTWKLEGEKSFEKWAFADDTLLTGIAYHIELEAGEEDEEETVITEAIRLVARGGNFFYIPFLPKQTGTVQFEIVSFTKNSFAAENKKHDFPTRIVYRLENPDKLHAYIEGKANDRKKRIDYLFTRQKP